MGRRDLAVHGMVPADQGFGAALTLGGEIELGLVDNFEFATAKRKTQLVLDHAAALQRLVHAFLEEAHALAAVALGARQGNCRVTQERGGVVAVGGREREHRR